jgi:hypothetical protein
MEGGGLAVYHIDDKADAQNNRGYPSTQSDWPKNGKHYQVALLPADGDYDLEKGTNEGDSGDLWHFGSELKELRSGSASHPNTDSYQYGSVKPTGVRIYGFGFSGKSMTFRVEGLDMSAASAGSADGIAVSLESIMTPKPTPNPSTPRPATVAPTSNPPSPSTIAKAPTKTPSRMPVTSSTTSPRTSPPTTRHLLCTDLCLEEIASSECPLAPYELPNCVQVLVGELCDANGECGSNQTLNNCPPFDVYRRMDCMNYEPTIDTTTNVNHSHCPYYPGWNNGLAHCLNDCRQPEFMISNQNYEFDSIEECCLIHYQGKSSCLMEQPSLNFFSRS